MKDIVLCVIGLVALFCIFWVLGRMGEASFVH